VVPFSRAYTHTLCRVDGIGDRLERNCPVCTIVVQYDQSRAQHESLMQDGRGRKKSEEKGTVLSANRTAFLLRP
jgi:hypothetical protein